ncbi:type II toxin-antitoxin system CcdA family antitoxin [Roseicyclus persicicus]|uniref:Type II toxin-antitoxin system CcdA family antitoxin n=1 Tax=Roseicyclus persicicus TaxID=2650661 RepID=A0A7X6GZA8_9RHOB|nr:type II toxin-antitoxin system CcdA family antitoxin [Roseibacterium persicicum]NKX45108.1 type II toxin-antitoxin system CcdA family antitoxin [Roseibacterium persicicum]
MGKQRTNITIDADLLAYAREKGLNVSAITEEALRAARREAWAQENAAAIDSLNAWVEQNGLPLAKYQVLKV